MTRGDSNSLVREAQRIIDEYIRESRLEAGERRMQQTCVQERKKPFNLAILINILLLMIAAIFIWLMLRML